MAVVETVMQPGHLHTIKEHTAGHSTAMPVSQPIIHDYDDLPWIVHAHEQKALKSEDVIYVRRVAEPTYGNVHSIFIVCDGHQGANAAHHCVEHMPGLLGQLLPPHLPNWSNMRDIVEYGEKVRRAISTAAVLLDNDATKKSEESGTTLTLAVVSGWLLTIANTGDSNAIIDMGDNVQEITHSHRIQVNKEEQNRLRQHGAQLAPLGFHLQGPAKPQEMGVGPLRVWPGGLCVSRSIGDLDAGPLIVPLPHIRQVLLTRRRALRLIMASDGLWDLVSFSKAAKTVRHKLPTQAVSSLIQMVSRDRRMADDISIIIADLLPPSAPGVTPQQFPAAALQVAAAKNGSSSSSGRTQRSSSGGGLFSCFRGSSVMNDAAAESDARRRSFDRRWNSEATPGPTNRPWNGLEWFADVDCYDAYPVHGQQLARASVDLSRRPSPPLKRPTDYTVHGGQAHKFQQDFSWHTGASLHGADNAPTFLSQQQLQALLDQGPAAAAAMVLSGSGFAYPQQDQQQRRDLRSQDHDLRSPAQSDQGIAAATAADSGSSLQQRQQQSSDSRESLLLMMGSGMLDSNAAAAAAASLEGRVRGGSSGHTILGNGQQQQQPASGTSSHRLATAQSSAAATVPVAAGSSTASNAQRSGPASPEPDALLRSASAVFEHDGSGVYVAGDDGLESGQMATPGRVVSTHEQSDRHFGSAPIAVPNANNTHGPASLAAAAASGDPLASGLAVISTDDEDESAMQRLGVRSALSMTDA